MRWLLLAILIIPIIEIMIFVLVGNHFGVWWVLGLIALTAVVGIFLARHQGLENWRRAQESMHYGEYPAQYIVDGLCILVGAILLITPGFLTDILGFILLIPWTRRVVKTQLLNL